MQLFSPDTHDISYHARMERIWIANLESDRGIIWISKLQRLCDFMIERSFMSLKSANVENQAGSEWY